MLVTFADLVSVTNTPCGNSHKTSIKTLPAGKPHEFFCDQDPETKKTVAYLRKDPTYGMPLDELYAIEPEPEVVYD